MTPDRRWVAWGSGGALFGLALLGANRLPTHHAIGVTIAISGGSLGFFVAGGSPFRTGVLERTRSMLSGSAWALGFLAAATLLFSWGSLYDALPFAVTHSNHSITRLVGGGVVETYSGSTDNVRQGPTMFPACLAVLGFLGLFFERTFLRMSFGDRSRLPWVAPITSGIIFAVVGSLTIVTVPLFLMFLAVGGRSGYPGPSAAVIVLPAVALLTGFACGCALGFGIDWLRGSTNSAAD